MSARAHDFGDILIEWITEWHVSHHASFKESKWANTLGTINNLIRHDEIPRLNSLLQTSNCRERNHGPDTNAPERSNVGAVRYLVGRNLVVGAVTTEECDGHILAGDAALVMNDGDRRGGLAPGSLDFERGDFGEAGEILKASSADDRNADFVFSLGQRWNVQWVQEQRNGNLPLYSLGRAAIFLCLLSIWQIRLFCRRFYGKLKD